MKGFLISCFISIILLSAFTLSQESPELSHSKINYISLSDMYGSRIRNSDVELKIIVENKEHQHFNLVSDDEGNIKFYTTQTNIDIEIIVDDEKTPEKDYYGKFALEEGILNDTEIRLSEIGKVTGVVMDSLDNVVPYAELKLECGDTQFQNTDKFGSFSFKNTETGSCKIFAKFEEGVGFQEINIEKGQNTDIILKLDKTLINYDTGYSSFLWIVPLVFLIVAIYILANSKYALRKKDSRKEDIMKTLTDKEKKVVSFLLGDKKYFSQNQISRKTEIPKTSLCRIIERLENKNIISIKKIGKFKKIKINDWFLSK